MTNGRVVLIITIYLGILLLLFVLVSVFWRPKAKAPVFKNATNTNEDELST